VKVVLKRSHLNGHLNVSKAVFGSERVKLGSMEKSICCFVVKEKLEKL